MKKYWKYRYYTMALIGVCLMFVSTVNCLSTPYIIIWGVGLFLSIGGTGLQIIFAPDYRIKK